MSDGDNEGENWIGIFKINSGNFIVLEAGCDYTGWDCQSWGSHAEYGSLKEALSPLNLTREFRERLASQLKLIKVDGSLKIKKEKTNA